MMSVNSSNSDNNNSNNNPNTSCVSHESTCLCKKIRLSLTLDDKLQNYPLVCHCKTCNIWNGSVVTGVVFIPYGLIAKKNINTDSHNNNTVTNITNKPISPLRILEGKEYDKCYCHTQGIYRHFCSECGTHIYNSFDSPIIGEAVSIFPYLFPEVQFQPIAHNHYENHKLSVIDDLPHYWDMPTHYGGSGKLVQKQDQ